jgi:hypothetical protein
MHLCIRCTSSVVLVKLVFRFMVFNVTFNNTTVISWRSVLLEEETRVPGENHRPVASHWQTWWHKVVSSTPLLSSVKLDCNGSINIYVYTLWFLVCTHKVWTHSQKSFEYNYCKFHTHTPKLSNQNAVFTGYDILIGCFSSRSTKLVIMSVSIFYMDVILMDIQ